MNRISFINEKGTKVDLDYSSYYLYNKTLNKMKHSKKLKLVYYGGLL